jgi:SAM-dependent methyltransferase
MSGAPTRQRLKQHAKQLARRTIGEPYVGKRMKLHRLDDVFDHLTLSPRAVLDAGAEDATFVYWLADRFPAAAVKAVDIDDAAIAACLAARPARYAARVSFEVSYFADLAPESVDLVTALDVLEHIEDDRGAAADLYAALRPGGTMLVHVPRNRWRTRSGHEHWVPDEDAWQINPGHVRTGYSPEAMRELLEGAGFEVRLLETWIGRWGTLAHDVYARLEHPAPLRLLSVPVTDVCSWLDKRQPTADGNSVFAVATKPHATRSPGQP